MSDREESPEIVDNGDSPGRRSAQSEGSDRDAGSPAASENGHSPRPVGRRSRSRSRSNSRRNHSSRNRRSRSHSSSRKYNNGSRHSPDHKRTKRDRSLSPMSSRRRHVGHREDPPPNRCLGVFGLSTFTTERDLKDVFGKYGALEDVQIVYDGQTRRSRGFGFVYFENKNDANQAKERCNGIDLGGRNIRVDFSVTERAHTPTPGVYLGKPESSFRSRGGGFDRDRRGGGGGFDDRRNGRSFDDRRGGGRSFDDRRNGHGFDRRGGGGRGSPSPSRDFGSRRDRRPRSRSPSPRKYSRNFNSSRY